MPWKIMCSIEKLAGKLISVIQKEWNLELGEPQADESENVMYIAHDLLNAVKENNFPQILCGKTVTEYLGKDWVKDHPSVLLIIKELDSYV